MSTQQGHSSRQRFLMSKQRKLLRDNVFAMSTQLNCWFFPFADIGVRDIPVVPIWTTGWFPARCTRLTTMLLLVVILIELVIILTRLDHAHVLIFRLEGH